MKHQRDLQFCIDELKSMQERDGLQPEQKRALKIGYQELKQLRRNPNPDKEDVYRAVRKVTEGIVKAFVRRK